MMLIVFRLHKKNKTNYLLYIREKNTIHELEVPNVQWSDR